MPAAGAEGVGVKLVTIAPANGARGLPLIHGLYVLFRVRPKLRKLVGPDGKPLEEPVGLLDAPDDAEAEEPVPDELAAPDTSTNDTSEDGEPETVEAESTESIGDEAAATESAEGDGESDDVAAASTTEA